MKILFMDIKKGVVKAIAENLDDLWHLYNIISPGDEIQARTTREIKAENDYARPKGGRRLSIFLGVKVDKVIWDRSLDRLRVHGIVSNAPEKVSVKGSHHTINVTVNKPINIVKSKWHKHDIDRLDRARKAKVAPTILLSIDDDEYCIAVLRQFGVDVKVDGKTRLPGKMESEKRMKALQEFFHKTLDALRNVWMDVQSPIVVIGPGFRKNEFVKYLQSKAPNIFQEIIDVKGVNSGGLAGINEAMRSGVLNKALKHLRIIEETKIVEELLTRLGKGRTDISYGYFEVERASLFGAVETLLLVDVTFREASEEKRLSLEKLMKDVEGKSGGIIVISSEHEAGIKLLSLGGVAALLRFPLT